MSSRSSPDLLAPASLAIHLDVVGGIAGDMFVAAMVDALPTLEPAVMDALAAVRPPDRAMPAFVAATSGALAARRFDCAQARAHTGGAHDATPYPVLRGLIAGAPLAADTREHALALMALLAQAEARVHGIAVDAVHFHELADWDSLMDVVAAGAIAARLAGARWSASSLPRGGGTVRTAHGTLPVPAPATVALLDGYPWHDDDVAGERVTPTGAAILRHLVPAEACGARACAGRLVASGCGAGTRTLPGMPNVLRALVFEAAGAATGDAVTTVEFDVDDMTGEEIALAADRLRAVAGVIDVSLGTRAGKKGRPLTEFRVLARQHAAEDAIAACFAETSTIGLRLRDERRRVLARDEVAVGAPPLAVKRVRRPDGTRTAKAAHDGVAGVSGLAARRRARADGERRALEDDE